MPAEKEYVQWLTSVSGIGYARCRQLLAHFGSAQAVWEASQTELLQTPFVTNKMASEILASKKNYSFGEQADFLKRHGIRTIHVSDPEYPRELLQIYDPPHLLYAKGQFSPADSKAISVVGSRNPTNYGVLVTNKLCAELAAGGVTIVSGLARGIDTAAHEAALHAGGRTIAVLAGGILRVYPAQNRSLANRISRQGLLLSEFHPLAETRPGMFPVRNRIIAGISRGVLVVEAGRKSGSLITADLALEQSRDVLAVPGPITSPLSRGTNDLIRQGAKMVTSVDDIWEEYPDWRANHRGNASQAGHLTDGEKRLLDLIGYGCVHMDQLLRISQLPRGELHRTLLEMELKGLVRQMPGQMYMRQDV